MMHKQHVKLLAAILQRDVLPALTMTEPWCSLMASKFKRVETRTWRPLYRGPIALHAASTLPRDIDEICRQDYFYEALYKRHFRHGRWSFPTRHILAIGMLEEVVPTESLHVSEREQAFGNFEAGRYAWRFSALYRLEVPIRACGSLGVWQWRPPESFWQEIQIQHERSLISSKKG